MNQKALINTLVVLVVVLVAGVLYFAVFNKPVVSPAVGPSPTNTLQQSTFPTQSVIASPTPVPTISQQIEQSNEPMGKVYKNSEGKPYFITQNFKITILNEKPYYNAGEKSVLQIEIKEKKDGTNAMSSEGFSLNLSGYPGDESGNIDFPGTYNPSTGLWSFSFFAKNLYPYSQGEDEVSRYDLQFFCDPKTDIYEIYNTNKIDRNSYGTKIDINDFFTPLVVHPKPYAIKFLSPDPGTTLKVGVEYTAIFDSLINQKINLSAEHWGKSELGGVQLFNGFISGNTIKFSIPSPQGYRYDENGWFYLSLKNSNYQEIAKSGLVRFINSDRTLSAYVNQAGISAFVWCPSLSENFGCGSITKNPEKTLYNFGDAISLNAIPSKGYRFSHWWGEGSEFCANTNQNPCVFTFPFEEGGIHVIYGQFEKIN